MDMQGATEASNEDAEQVQADADSAKASRSENMDTSAPTQASVNDSVTGGTPLKEMQQVLSICLRSRLR